LSLEDLALAYLDNNVFDIIKAASAVQLQMDPGTAIAAPEPATRADPSSAEPAPATAASEPSAPGEPAPTELAPKADATLPDLPPPSSDRTKLKLVAENKSRPLMPLLLMAQVSAYPPAASYRDLGAMC
jgi:hypothetical protein